MKLKEFTLIKKRAGQRAGTTHGSFWRENVNDPSMLKKVRKYHEQWLDGYNNSLTFDEIEELLDGFKGYFSYDVFTFELVENE